MRASFGRGCTQSLCRQDEGEAWFDPCSESSSEKTRRALPEGVSAGSGSSALMRDGRRQAHGEARARARGRVRFHLGRAAVLGPDPAPMRLDDLPRNRKAKARILAEALIRPIRVEALKNALERVLGDSRPFILDDDLDEVAPAG